MGKLLDIVSPLHRSTTRDHLGRMLDEKPACMGVAKKFGSEYWDGERRFGYGGYRYIPGRWKSVARALIDRYKLGPGSSILDVGCGKGFLLHEMLLIEPQLKICGFDISQYAIDESLQTVKNNLFVHRAQDIFPFESNSFEFVMSLGTLHNLKLYDLKIALEEIERVGKQSFLMVESYRSDSELFNLQCWALTCQSFFGTDEWLWIFDRFGFSGDYEFIYFE